MKNPRLNSFPPALARLSFAAALVFAAFALAQPASAVPAFAVQTGQPCNACHVGGFGPQLTPYGRTFKLGGYTTRSNTWNVPLSVMGVASYVHTQQDQGGPPADGFHNNDNIGLDQISFFLAGGLGSHFGAFVQTTYDGIHKVWHWDNTDLRATTTVQVKDTPVVLGISLNNNPTVQDAWNTTPAWGFPYTTSSLAPAPSTVPLLNGAFAQTTVGVTGYTWINSEFFLEGGVYGSPGAQTLINLGVDPTIPGDITGVAPYGRAVFQHALGGGTLELGLMGMQANIHPGRDNSTGDTDNYTDLGVDGSFQKVLGNSDVISLNARYLHEQQTLNATCVLNAPSSDSVVFRQTAQIAPPEGCASNHLDDVRVDASYYWRNKIGGSVQVFDTTGNANPIVYSGNRTFKPDSSGVVLQLDGTPWGTVAGSRFNVRVGVQYTIYTQFNGAASNFDDAGTNASANNTLRVFVWTAY
ncbi:MAG: hypothetical protein ACHP84_02010 [Caulobacterales bacterium]